MADHDPLYTQPFIDVDEWRDEPVRHRYVHGGFDGADLRFSFYLPPPERYEGRFFQHITPVPDSEHLADGLTGEEDKIGFCVASGAYFVETNGGGPSGTPGSDIDPTIAAYRANASAARYSRVVAAEMYGEHRTYGYSYGGSGGGYRTIGGAENTSGVWDGFVPYVIGSPLAIPNVFTVRMHAQRILRDRFDQIDDAVDAGGSREPEAGLDEDEREAFREVTRMGFPIRSWFGHRTMGLHAFPLLFGGVSMADPAYFEDFWTEPGYLGSEAPESLVRDTVHHATEVVAVVSAEEAEGLGIDLGHLPVQVRGGVDTAGRAGEPEVVPVAIRVARGPDADILGAELVVTSGQAEGARLGVLTVVDDLVVLSQVGGDTALKLRPGDTVEVDNRRYLAAQTYHRHQVPEPEFTVWDQFRGDDGEPLLPQRPLLLGPLFAQAAAGTVQTGVFEGKMIVVSCLLDREAFPWQADWYRSKVEEHLGGEADDRFRLWYVDHALHGDETKQEHPTRTVSYLGVLHQALRDLSAWVEQGVEPASSTHYEIVEGQVVVPPEAHERGSVQPVVWLTPEHVDVGVGEEFVLDAVAEVPDATGSIVSLEWDLDGSGQFALSNDVEPVAQLIVERRLSFDEPGTHFVTVRVASQREPDGTPYARLQNLARARVVVT
jgi:hypothetical protein